MSGSIQESEMYIASQYCKKFVKELTDVLVCETKIYDTEILNCNNKIQSEQNDIVHLKEQINLCNSLLQSNRQRLTEIPGEIETYKEDITQCKTNMSNTEYPVYRERYDKYSERWYEEKDYEATYNNGRYIVSLKSQISDDENAIRRLHDLQIRCENNIHSLTAMISNINAYISKKQNLINKIQQDIPYLQSSFNTFKKTINNLQNEIITLNRKIINGAELVHNCGSCLAQIGYKGLKCSYSDKDIVTITSDSLNQEIQLLNAVISTNVNNISLCSKGTISFGSQLQDNVTSEFQSITVKALKELNNINQNYISYEALLKKALAFIISYESIKIW